VGGTVAVGVISTVGVSGIGVGGGVCVGVVSTVGVEVTGTLQAVIKRSNPINKMSFFIVAPINEIRPAVYPAGQKCGDAGN
jgi:hypothetical protein